MQRYQNIRQGKAKRKKDNRFSTKTYQIRVLQLSPIWDIGKIKSLVKRKKTAFTAILNFEGVFDTNYYQGGDLMAKGRASNGNGNVVTHKGRAKPYQVQYTLDGQRKSGGYFATMEEANKALRAITSGIDAGTHIEPSKMTLQTWSEIWLKEYQVESTRSTTNSYETIFRLHILPVIGKKQLCQIQSFEIQSLINSLKNQRTGESLASKTVKCVHGALSSCLAQAVKLKYIRENPAEGCKLPRKDHDLNDPSATIKPMDGAELARFFEAAKGDEYEQLFIFARFTGMRLSEILGLQWSRINFDRQEITVDQQQYMPRRKGETMALVATKSRNRRKIKVAAKLMNMLKLIRTEQLKNKLKAGDIWQNRDNLVFVTETGSPYRHNAIDKHFSRIAARADLTDHVFHDLRHTFIVEMLRNGVDIETVSKYAGHFDPGFTLKVYADMTEDMANNAANIMDRMMANI